MEAVLQDTPVMVAVAMVTDTEVQESAGRGTQRWGSVAFEDDAKW